MKAAVLHALGKPPCCEEFREPIADEGEVIVQVLAAALKPVDKAIANGSHYASRRELPVVCGTEGVGRLDDGTRVFFAGLRSPYGAMAERAVVSRSNCFAIAADLDDATAAALINPGMSAWLTLKRRAQLVPGERVLILGATGVTGKLAVQTAKLLGAARVVAAGRNVQVLNSLHDLGANATIPLNMSTQDLTDAFIREAGDAGFNVIVDYLWGRPTEALLAAITRPRFAAAGSETRLVQVGESAGPTITLAAAVLRSTPLTILGTAGIPPRDTLVEGLRQIMAYATSGQLRIDVEPVPLAGVEKAWQRESPGRRVVVIP